MSGEEWEADVLRGDKLEVPEEDQRRMRHRIIVTRGDRTPAMVAWCAAVQFHPVGNVLELQDALVDTSDKFQGTTVKARVTHHAKVLLWGLGAIILPYRYKREEGPGG